MFKVGDIVKYSFNGVEFPNSSLEFSDQSFEVFQLPASIDDDILLGLKNIKTGQWENYYRFPLKFDKQYYRKQKLKKICSKLEIV